MSVHYKLIILFGSFLVICISVLDIQANYILIILNFLILPHHFLVVIQGSLLFKELAAQIQHF